MSQHDLLLLDEAMNALDVDNKQKIIQYLRKIHHHFNLPMLIVSHDLDVITQLCDSLLIIGNQSRYHTPNQWTLPTTPIASNKYSGQQRLTVIIRPR